MDSRKALRAFDIQNDDTEIDLQFQDFGSDATNTGRADEAHGSTIYFNSFPDSAVDDQEQKLLGDEDDEGRSKATHSFWTFEYYQQFFDVESRQVGDRIIWSMVPKPGVNFLQSYIRPNPDLYGPFWICVTLVLTTGVAGNLSSYLQSSEPHRWRYDFHKVSLATSSIFSYAWLVPLLIFGLLYWRRSKANISLLELICLYGYSLAVFVPVSLLWIIPLPWLQWCLGIVASVLSGSVLVRTIQPAISHEAKNIALGLAVLILVLHAALALGFMLYFFYPSTASTSAIIENPQAEKSNGSVPLPKSQDGKETTDKQADKEVVKKEEDKKLSVEREEKSVNKERAVNDEKDNKGKENLSKPMNKLGKVNKQINKVKQPNVTIKENETSKENSTKNDMKLEEQKGNIVTTLTSKTSEKNQGNSTKMDFKLEEQKSSNVTTSTSKKVLVDKLKDEVKISPGSKISDGKTTLGTDSQKL